MTAKELTDIINMTIEAVEKSKAGPVFAEKDGQIVWHTFGKDTFIAILQCVVPRPLMEMQASVAEPKEPWQQ